MTPTYKNIALILILVTFSFSVNAQYNTMEVKNYSYGQDFTPKMSITKNGKMAYFSKAVYKKPLYGLFSKKELVHEIYSAEKVNGEWANIKKLAVCPDHFSATHPTISPDGKRLFFASNMPGSYGDYDIYVADIKRDGTVGTSKNLGPKVNTKKDELYPSIQNETMLVFASGGREGFGGLDLYATQVTGNSLSKSVNLGNDVNSNANEYAYEYNNRRDMGYVMSDRTNTDTAKAFAVSSSRKRNSSVAKNDANLMKLLNDNSQIEYSTTVFEEE